MKNINVGIASLKENARHHFQDLSAYSAYILHHKFDAFSSMLHRLYVEANLPMAGLFPTTDRETFKVISTSLTREMLSLVAAGQVQDYINQAREFWLGKKFPMISGQQVQLQDITLANAAKAKALRHFLQSYTSDIQRFSNLVEEIDRFVVMLNSQLYTAYLDFYNQTVNTINAALQKREKQLLEAQEIGQIASFEWDFIAEDSSFTPQMFKIVEPDDVKTFAAFLVRVHPEDREKVIRAVEKAKVDGAFECGFRLNTYGEERFIHSRARVQYKNGRPVRMIGTLADATERYKIIHKLEKSEGLHKQAQALAHIGNWSWSVNGNKISWSDEMYRIYGLAPQSEQITYERFISFIHPNDRPRRIAQIKRSLETLKVEEYHFKITTARGELKILRGKGEVIADQQNKAVLMLGTCQDVTHEFILTQQLRERERYLQELNRSLEAANQELSRTNEELESFNFIASHDLQEPLRKIQVYSNRILENGTAELSPGHRDYFARINSASKRMQKLIEDFLLFSQTGNASQPPEPVNLNAIVEEITSELITRVEEKKATIAVSILPEVMASPFQIKQLMVNLISNSLKYTRPDVPPVIKISGCLVDGSEFGEPGARPGVEYAMISVADNGIGFDPKYTAKIFELFQRLHSNHVYSGTGIGLPLCKKIVQKLRGFIHAKGDPGKGAVFTVYLPTGKAPAAVA